MSLREFLLQMEKEKEVLHVTDPVSPKFEITYVLKSFDKQGPVLMFEKVKGCPNKIVANVCGSRKRLCTALNVSGEQLYRRMLESWRCGEKPKIASSGAVEEKCEKNVDLSKLPILTHFEKDAGAYITSAVVHTKGFDGKTENVSIHRLQVLSKKLLAIRLVPRHLYQLWTMAREAVIRQDRTNVAIVFNRLVRDR
ncbi:MAG: UbiD family decarboxylase [Candidatus Bathyarchaeia archaeon]